MSDGDIYDTIANELGMDASRIVNQRLGGVRVPIPPAHKLKETHLLVRKLGMELARKVALAINATEGSIREVFPLGLKGIRYAYEAQRSEIAKRLEDGMTVREVALELECSQRTVTRVRVDLTRRNPKKVEKLRLKRVLKLLLEGQSIHQVALATGVQKLVVSNHRNELIREGKLNASK